MHIEAISNGMGSCSMRLLVLAAEGEIDAKLSITGDTGSESDALWNTGERTTAKKYFDQVTEPYAREHGIEAVFVRAHKKDGKKLEPIIALLAQGITAGVPLFGSEGGRLPQGCTHKWKIRAVRQELRRRGAITAQVALGLTLDEVGRIKGSDVKWCKNWWPLIQLKKMYRATAIEHLERRDIPYLLSTECDMCPHKDYWRWSNTEPRLVEYIAELERKFSGLFFTPMRTPLLDAIQQMKDAKPPDMFCTMGGYCYT